MSVSAFLVFWLLLILLEHLEILFHESMYCRASRSVGWPVLSVTVGTGPVLWRGRDRHSTVWTWRLWPINGEVCHACQAAEKPDLRLAAKQHKILVAGPWADFLFFFLVLILATVLRHFGVSISALWCRQAFLLASCTMTVFAGFKLIGAFVLPGKNGDLAKSRRLLVIMLDSRELADRTFRWTNAASLAIMVGAFVLHLFVS